MFLFIKQILLTALPYIIVIYLIFYLLQKYLYESNLLANEFLGIIPFLNYIFYHGSIFFYKFFLSLLLVIFLTPLFRYIEFYTMIPVSELWSVFITLFIASL